MDDLLSIHTRVVFPLIPKGYWAPATFSSVQLLDRTDIAKQLPELSESQECDGASDLFTQPTELPFCDVRSSGISE